MRELYDILQECARLVAQGTSGVMATVVKVNGSAYRRAGARMLLLPDGAMIGSVSGGCLEQDVAERAKSVQPGRPQLVTYDLQGEDDVIVGLGMGCQGWVEVLLEKVPEKRAVSYYELLGHCLRQKKAAVLATVFRVTGELKATVGNRYFLQEDGLVHADISDHALALEIGQNAAETMSNGRTQVLTHELESGTAEVLYEAIQPIFLLVIGGNQNTLPVVSLAHALGWLVTVCDSRRVYADQSRFPQAEVVYCPVEEIAGKLSLTPRTAAVLLSHNNLYDKAALKTLLFSPVRYVGLLGTRSRSERLLNELTQEGLRLHAAEREKLYSPVGLDIGADTPQEMALAIVAEISAVFSGRRGSFLRDRKRPIHGQ
jgi:xanthine/CO dehydrogenase XdhC/CoxF family maturation factor